MGATAATAIPSLGKAAQIGELALGDGHVAFLLIRYFQNEGIDKFLASYIAFFILSIGGLDNAGASIPGRLDTGAGHLDD